MIRPKRRFHHAAHGGPRQPEGGGKIDLEHVCPILILHAHGEIVAGDPGIVDQNVDAAHGGFGRGDRAFPRSRVGEIGRQEMRPLAELARKPVEHLGAVPDSATVAPWAWSARAIAAPMPPVAPVTSAACRPDRTWLASCQHPQQLGCRSDLLRRADAADALRLGQHALAQAGQHLAGAELDESRDALATKKPRIRASEPPRDLADELPRGWPPDRSRGAAVTLATSGTVGRFSATALNASAMISAAGCIRAQWKGALTGRSMPAWRPAPWRSRPPARPPAGGRRPPPGPAHCHWPPGTPGLRRLPRQWRPPPRQIEAEQRRHGARCRPGSPAAWPGRGSSAAGRHRTG